MRHSRWFITTWVFFQENGEDERLKSTYTSILGKWRR